MTLTERLVAAWFAPRLNALTLALVPLSLLFWLAIALRRALYRSGVLRTVRVAVPVIVVGNVTVGGSGKTPLVRALADALAARGWRPGIVSRGYGGSNVDPRAVERDDDPSEVGDEPPLLVASGHPVWIAHDRPRAVSELLRANPSCNVILSDDGLQHYALGRTAEIGVVDASRGFGNGRLLPAGPLREPLARLREVDAIVNVVPWGSGAAYAKTGGRESSMAHEPVLWRNVARPDATKQLSAWRSGEVHAVAGIGNPQRFFDTLRALGVSPICHAYPDHHAFVAADLAFDGATAILMTEKDAVKCVAFAGANCWYLAIRTHIDDTLVALIEGKLRGSQAARNPGLSRHEGSPRLR
jgi:tetraacyldisaccharide 4'-kinase